MIMDREQLFIYQEYSLLLFHTIENEIVLKKSNFSALFSKNRGFGA